MTEKFSIEFSSNGNAAFEDARSEIVRILKETARRLEQGDSGSDGDGFRLNDINGHKCGRVTIERDDDDEEDE